MKTIPTPLKIYEKLYGSFGPQGWWPVTKKGKKYPGYYPLSYTRKTENEKLEICIGAILTQNTAWTNASKALSNLNNEKLLNIKKISTIKTADLAKLIRPSGYYNQKAERIKNFVLYLARKYKDNPRPLFNDNTEKLRNELLSLSGIGPETADSMLLYAANKPVFVVDAYTVRIGSRIGWFGKRNSNALQLTGKNKDYTGIQNFFYSNLPGSFKIYNEFHALLVALGKDFCRKKPVCTNCPVRSLCEYFKDIKIAK